MSWIEKTAQYRERKNHTDCIQLVRTAKCKIQIIFHILDLNSYTVRGFPPPWRRDTRPALSIYLVTPDRLKLETVEYTAVVVVHVLWQADYRLSPKPNVTPVNGRVH